MLLLKKSGIRIKKTLFKLLILLLPIQLSKHFWPSWANISGIRVDYLAPAVYLTDIVLAILLLVWFIEIVSKKRVYRSRPKNRNKFLLLLAILLFVALNIAGALNPQAALVRWIKLFQMTAFILFLVRNGRFIKRKLLFYPLSAAIVYSTAIGIAQFVLQRTLGGPFYFLGERTFGASTPGIALGYYFGNLLLRPYATFPHPNALAGFLVVAFFLVAGEKTKSQLEKVVKGLASVCTLLLLLLTNSQGAWLVLLLCGLSYLMSKTRPRLVPTTISLLFVLAVGLSVASPMFFQKLTSQDNVLSQSVERRISLTVAAGQMLGQKPIFGVGLNNFLVELNQRGTPFDLAWFLQPVHNIFLLVFAEAGLLGFFLFIYILAKAYRNLYSRKKYTIFVTLSLLAVVLTGVLDHYWLTLQQNQLLFSLVLGLSLRKDD